MSSLPTITEEFSEDQDLTKICDYKNLSFFMANIPEPVNDPDYISYLISNEVRMVVRTKKNSFNWLSYIAGVIPEIIVNFTDPIADGFIVDFFISSLKGCIARGEPASIVMEGSVNGAYMLAYALVELGVNWKKSLKEIEKTGLQLEKLQVEFLHYKSHEHKQQQEKTCSVS